MLEIVGLRVVIAGKPVIDDLSLAVAEQEVVGLIGAPGCGKSTLLKSVFVLVPTAAGEIRYGGRNVANRSSQAQIRDGIVLVAQGGQVFRGLPVEENLYLAGYTLDPAHAEGDQIADEDARVYGPACRAKRQECAYRERSRNDFRSRSNWLCAQSSTRRRPHTTS